MDFHVRWNSTYLMIKRFLELEEIVKKLIDELSMIDGIKEIQKKIWKNGVWIEIVGHFLKPYKEYFSRFILQQNFCREKNILHCH